MTYVGVDRIPGIWSDEWQIHTMPNVDQKWISFLISFNTSKMLSNSVIIAEVSNR